MAEGQGTYHRLGAGPEESIRFLFEGQPVTAKRGDTVASALMLAGVSSFRETPVSGAARAPYCLMGVCFECLVEIDGVANRQACMIAVREGMQVRRQRGAVKTGEAMQ